MLPFLESVHARPETVVLVREELSLFDESIKGFLNELLAFLHIVEDLFSENEESSVGPKSRTGLAFDALNPILTVCVHNMETIVRRDANKAGYSVFLQERFGHFPQVYVT